MGLVVEVAEAKFPAMMAAAREESAALRSLASSMKTKASSRADRRLETRETMTESVPTKKQPSWAARSFSFMLHIVAEKSALGCGLDEVAGKSHKIDEDATTGAEARGGVGRLTRP